MPDVNDVKNAAVAAEKSVVAKFNDLLATNPKKLAFLMLGLGYVLGHYVL